MGLLGGDIDIDVGAGVAGGTVGSDGGWVGWSVESWWAIIAKVAGS